jgi:hypothetical protein
MCHNLYLSSHYGDLCVLDFEAAPTDVTIGDLSVHTELKFKITNGFEIPFLRFSCSENPAHDRSDRTNLLYSTYW